MNERMRELLEQAGVTFVVMPKDTEYEKFAELIVRECIDIVENQGAFMRYNHLAEQIRTHFGIKKR
jgi:hypothetical protein